MIRNAAAQRGLARSRSIPVSAKPAGKPLPASLHCLLPIATVALAVSQSEQETQGKRASPLEPPNRVVPRVNLAYMQDKRRRNDFASTEVGEVKGGRVTQQAFEVAYKKDSGISMQRCQEREATGGRTPRKMARLKEPAPASSSVPLIFEEGRGEKPGRQSTTQAQGLKIFSSHHPPWHKQAESRDQMVAVVWVGTVCEPVFRASSV